MELSILHVHNGLSFLTCSHTYKHMLDNKTKPMWPSQSLAMGWRLEIPITAMNAKGLVEEYWRKKGCQLQPHQSGPSHLQFSQEAFVNALVKFIIADDQVCHSIIQPSQNLIGSSSCSPLMSLSHLSCRPFSLYCVRNCMMKIFLSALISVIIL